MRTVMVSVALALSCGTISASEVVELDAATQARAGIVVRPVLERSFGDQLRIVGQVVRQPGSTLVVKSVLAGRVEDLRATPGETVSAGETLLAMHSHELLRMQAELLTANERAELAATRLDAGEELLAIEGISRLELKAREQEAFAVRLERDAAYEELVDHGMARETVDELLRTRSVDPHLPVAAPVDGVVLELSVQEHEWVEGYAPLLVLGDPARLEVEVQLPPDQASSVAVGDLVEFVPVGRPEETSRARVITRVPQVDPATRTLRVRAEILEGHPGLFPGVFVEGALVHGEARQAPSVPESAVINLGGSDVVFVQLTPTRYAVRPVELGRSNGTRSEILSGVDVGENVAVEGVFLLKSALVSGGGEEE